MRQALPAEALPQSEGGSVFLLRRFESKQLFQPQRPRGLGAEVSLGGITVRIAWTIQKY